MFVKSSFEQAIAEIHGSEWPIKIHIVHEENTLQLYVSQTKLNSLLPVALVACCRHFLVTKITQNENETVIMDQSPPLTNMVVATCTGSTTWSNCTCTSTEPSICTGGSASHLGRN